jgi:cyclohexanecarboxylate-CoA ligase
VYSIDPDPVCALEYFICGGADVPPELVRTASGVLDACVARVYGSSEFPTFSSGKPSDPLHRRAETDGRPIGIATGRLIDEVDGVGELIVNGKEMFLGYVNSELNDEAFTPDGYFRTGDLASIDADGFVTIRGRKKDIIIRGGENISAKEVEDHLYEHVSIKECAVVAMPDPVLGEKCCAFIIPDGTDSSALTVQGLSAHLKDRGVARQKHPERVFIVGELPKTASGKVQKFRLREMVAETLASEQ